MKNIHILPTDKPSRLQLNKHNKIFLSEELKLYSDCINQNIYITSDEEIKEGDWCVDDIADVFKIEGLEYFKKFCKKIILTTDQDLIKDGVQEIDDEFLEWFVKNPSCEKVEVNKSYGGTFYIEYPFVIPKEDLTKCYCGHTTTCDCGTEEPKQETLEKVADKASLLEFPIKEWYRSDDYSREEITAARDGFKRGYKLALERSYSEEEVVNILMKVYEDIGKRKIPNPVVLAEWFNKFKKK